MFINARKSSAGGGIWIHELGLKSLLGLFAEVVVNSRKDYDEFVPCIDSLRDNGAVICCLPTLDISNY